LIGVIWTAKVKPGMEQEFAEFLRWDAEVAREREPETLRFDVYKDPGDPDTFIIYEAYSSYEAFEYHKQQEPFQKFTAELHGKVRGFRWSDRRFHYSASIQRMTRELAKRQILKAQAAGVHYERTLHGKRPPLLLRAC